MLCYWILRRPDGTPAGLVRVQNDRVRLSLSAPIAGSFTLFSKADAVPILPESEMALPCPEAVLGADGDRVTCFASAEQSAPLAEYRHRLYLIRTIHTQKAVPEDVLAISEPFLPHVEMQKSSDTPDSEPDSDNISHFSPTQADSISDSARETQAFSLLLQRADAFFTAYEEVPTIDMVQNMDNTARVPDGLDLFSQEFPGARWRYVDGTDVLPHYEGTWKQPNGPTLHILAVRGHAAPRPPRSLLGFTRYLRDRDGTGYWLRLTPLP